MNLRLIQIIITLTASLFLIVHILLPKLSIDSTASTLLAIAILPWLAPLFKTIELPGVKVQFQDLKKVEEKVENAGLLTPASQSITSKRHIYTFESIANDDPNLALAGLRLELELKLRKIAKTRGLMVDRMNLQRLTRQLNASSILNQQEFSALQDLFPILNGAVHGAKVDLESFKWTMSIGPRLLEKLDEKMGQGEKTG